MNQQDLPFKDLRCERIGRDDYGSFRSMTFPAYQHLFDPAIEDEVYAVGLRASDEPVGLALARIGQKPDEWELASLFIQPFWENDHTRKYLFDELVAAIGQPDARGYYLFQVRESQWESRWQSLQSLGWHTPVYRGLCGYLTMETAISCDWINASLPPKGFEIAHWETLSKAQRRHLRARLEEGHQGIDETTNPFNHEENYHAPTSMVLLKHGEVYGWNMTHLLEEGVVRWSCSCILDRARHHGRIFALWRAVIWHQHSLGMKRFMFVVQRRQTMMARFTLQRLVPAGTEVHRLMHACYDC